MRHREGDKHTDILNAAIKVFCKNGFDGAKVADVAHAAGISSGAVYLYFANKETVLESVFTRFWDEQLLSSEGLEKLDPVEYLRARLTLFFDALSADRDLAELYLREHHRYLTTTSTAGLESYHKTLLQGEKVFQRGTKLGRIIKGTDVALMRSFLFGGVRAAVEFWLTSSLSAKQVRDRMLKMAVASVAPLSETRA